MAVPVTSVNVLRYSIERVLFNQLRSGDFWFNNSPQTSAFLETRDLSFILFLPACFFSYSQYEAKMKTLEADMKEMESKKRILEEAVDSLNEEIAKLKAKGNVQNCLLLRCNPEFSLPAT